MEDNDKRIILGKFASVFGVKGWIKVNSQTQPKENIFSYANWQIKIADQWQPCEIEQSRPHGKTLVVKLVGCDDRDEAQKFVGTAISVFRSELPEIEQDQYYWSDLLGMKVVNLSDKHLGSVKEILETGSNDVLVVTKKESGKKTECLIPWLEDDVIIEVNQQDKLISVDWDPDF